MAQKIELFGITQELGLSILADFFLWAYKTLACPGCGFIHKIELKDIIEIIERFPDTQEERNFLYYMAGCFQNRHTDWILLSTVMKTCKDEVNWEHKTHTILVALLEQMLSEEERDEEHNSEG